jgi:hypothetical protein
MTAAIAASKQQQIATAGATEDARLKAISDAALNAGNIAAQGFRLGMQNYYKA